MFLPRDKTKLDLAKFLQGILAPISGFSLLMVAFLEGDRVFWCHVLMLARWTIIIFYFNTIFFNFIFRMILVRFADRGLVVQGKPELLLFCQLYWVVFATFFTSFILSFPLLKIIRGSFLQSGQAKVCLFQPLEADEEGVKGRIMALAYPFIAEVFNQYYSRKVTNYLRKLCPNRRMSCIGKYRRNLLSFRDMSKYISSWAAYSVVQGSVMIAAMIFGSSKVSSTLVFWMHNLGAFLFIDFFHGVFTPLHMTLPSRGKRPSFTRRRQDWLEPRRHFVGHQPSREPSQPPAPPTSPLSVGGMLSGLKVTGLKVWQV